VLRIYEDFVSDAPDQLGSILNLRMAPPAPFIPKELHGAPMVGVIPCYCSDPDEGEKVLRPLRELRPDLYAVERRPFVEFQALFNATVPHGWHYYWKSHYLAPLTDGAIDAIAQRAWRARSPRSYTLIFHMGGAVARRSDDSAAFTGRNATHAININGVWTADDGDGASDTGWAREFFDAMQPYGTGGVYVNFLGNEGQDRVRAAYGPAKYERLARLKATWDPDNVFHMNQNILPASPD